MAYLSKFDQRQLRNVLSTFTTGVTVVTTRAADGKAYGVTVNSFSSVSLDPPLVLWSQATTSSSFSAFQATDSFAVNILAEDQIEVSNHFAKSQDDKFKGIAHREGINGVPVIDGAAAHLECIKVATYPGGDHVVYVGRVERISHSHRRPLAFSCGRYAVPYAHDLGPLSLQLCGAKIAHPDAIRMTIEEMRSIATKVGEHTLCLTTWGNHGPTTIYWEPSNRPVSGNFPVGLVLNVTSTAAGRAFAAFMPPGLTRAFIEEDLRLFRRAEEDPEKQRADFEREMDLTRERGLALAITAESTTRLHNVPTTAFAAPIFDESGSMVLALSMLADVERLTADSFARGPQALRAAAAGLSRKSRCVPL
jgi:flavin reductase (DIM6/NTAB) family NADH-FMN oxidoreductase RutF/DNA-binding IclR family transcriptional regulator